MSLMSGILIVIIIIIDKFEAIRFREVRRRRLDVLISWNFVKL